MTSTAEITTISQTAMDSSAYKVVRVLVQSDLNSDGNYYIKPFSRLFADVDLGVLEITTKMARNSMYPINSVESRKIAKRNTLDGNFSDLKFKDAPVALTKEVLTYDNIWNNY
jgi:Cu2+-containing amine oxidase